MTNVQPYLAIGLPIVANAAMIILLQQSMHRQLDTMRAEIETLRADMREIRSDVKLLTGKVYEMMAGRNQ
jgi:chaperonin cofactor prefoldin